MVLLYLVCFTFFIGSCVANDDDKYSVELHVKPSLSGDPHFYYSELKCPSRSTSGFENAHEHFMPWSDQQYDRAVLYIGDQGCPDGYLIGVAMFNALLHKNFDWSTWEKPLVLRDVKFPDNEFYMVKSIEFSHQFKLNISPKLAKDSKMFYRVNVYCAGRTDMEFKTYTQSETMVVFNSIERKCEKYDVKVWPIYQKWVDIDVPNKVLGQPELRQNGIRVANGQTHGINFENYFTLKIEPALKAKSGIYYVTLKCRKKKSAPIYKTYTNGKTKVVLAGAKCAAYDVTVSKLGEELNGEAKDIISIEAKHQEFGAKLKGTSKASTLEINYTEQQINHAGSEDEEGDEEDDDDDDGVDEDEDDGDDLVDRQEIDKIIAELDDDDLAGISDDQMDDEYDDGEEEDDDDDDDDDDQLKGLLDEDELESILKGTKDDDQEEHAYQLDSDDDDDDDHDMLDDVEPLPKKTKTLSLSAIKGPKVPRKKRT